MSKTINAALAALVLTTSVITGASAAFASGDYSRALPIRRSSRARPRPAPAQRWLPTMVATAPTIRVSRAIPSILSPRLHREGQGTAGTRQQG